MANELVHSSAGTTLTQAEFEAVGLHVCNSQATGDLIYASSATQLSRLAIGAADTVLTCNGTVPSWSATPILNTVIAKGTWTASGTWTIPAITLNGAVTLNGQVFNAGSGSLEVTTTGNNQGIKITNTQDGTGGAYILLKTISASPEVGDDVGNVAYWGQDATPASITYGDFRTEIADPSAGAASGKMFWRVRNAGTLNEAMTLSGAGGLWVDESITLNPVSAPATNVEGKLYYDSDDNKLKFYNGAAYETITSAV